MSLEIPTPGVYYTTPEAKLAKAFDRGDSDAYYRRPPEPHIWLDSLGQGRVSEADMTEEQVAAYWRGYDENPSGEKDWR